MPDKTFRVRLKTGAIHHVCAAKVEVHGEHLTFLNSDGKLAALFLLEVVERWNEISC